jgi:hypothetical protein
MATDYLSMSVGEYIEKCKENNGNNDEAEVVLYQMKGEKKYLTLVNRKNGGIYPFVYSFREGGVNNNPEKAPLFLFSGKHMVKENIVVLGDLMGMSKEKIKDIFF